MADVFTASLLRGLGDVTMDVLSQEARSANQPGLTREGMWLLCLCIFDFVLALFAFGLCYLSSSSPSAAPSSLSSSSSSTLEGTSGRTGTTAPRGRTYPACSYVHPLQIADDFRDRWRTRWTHQQYFEVMTYHNGDQFEVKNFRPVKNTFIQQRPGRMEHEISVSDYKRHCELAKKIVGYESVNDFKIKNASVVYRNYFRRTNEDVSQQKPAIKPKKAPVKHSSPETSPRDIVVQTGPKRSMLACTLCSRQYEYVTKHLAACAQSHHISIDEQHAKPT